MKMSKTLSQPYFSIKSCSKSCSICIQNYVKDYELISVLFCKHIFHTNCIEEWLINNNTCPLCRKKCYY